VKFSEGSVNLHRNDFYCQHLACYIQKTATAVGATATLINPDGQSTF
jgi:hypothetical protein